MILSEGCPQEIHETNPQPEFIDKSRRGSHKCLKSSYLMHSILAKLCQVYHECLGLLHF